ncbi:MAG: YbjN domain-containing protein [Deltaproteobacteria bacterium]|nr:YbjN domain-containing protein [Deltaproteobacteria bacterium]
MGRIFDGIKQFLESHFETQGFEPADDNAEGDATLAFRLEDEDGREWGCLAVASEDTEQLLFYSVVLDNVKPPQRPAVMEFLTRANYGLQVGNFELDLDDGEVRFKTSIDVERAELTEPLCKNLVELNLAMMGLYYAGLHGVMSGELTPAQAITKIEED